MKSQEQKGSLYAILSGFLYGFIGYFGLSAMNGNLSASTMLFWRFLISSVVILILLLPKIRKVNDSYKSMFIAFMSGALYYGISTLLYFYSSGYIGSGLAMVIFFTYPVIIMLLNYFFYGQFIPRIYYLATAIILIGMMLLIDMNEIAFDLSGILLGLASAFCYACYLVASKRNTLSPDVSTLMVCLGCMTTSLLVSFFSHSFTVPTTFPVWINLLGIGIVATVVPILLMLHSLKYISSEKASILSVLEPVFVVIFGVLLLGEELKPWHALGIVFVLAGALITLFSHKINLEQIKYRLFRSQSLS
ncbi:DMT family transporter [Legionella shakespearei]|uniref:Integral membrane protein n=1 Tax=Legionella shakespearei DSM 23087 TaxID=1122169 RepID=A0A0W0Z823_9GAMM|nr:DMT family transporter [Legionella shakespearei]KTD64934.1 integral membrane protein [Legionella shakespearei DSM 23087]